MFSVGASLCHQLPFSLVFTRLREKDVKIATPSRKRIFRNQFISKLILFDFFVDGVEGKVDAQVPVELFGFTIYQLDVQ